MRLSATSVRRLGSARAATTQTVQAAHAERVAEFPVNNRGRGRRPPSLRQEEEKPKMKSVIVQRSIAVNGRKTSISLEDPFWAALREIAAARQLTLTALVSVIDRERADVGNLSSALRTFILEQYQSAAASAGSPAASDQKKAPVTP